MVVSLEAMDAVLEVDELERFAVVGPGVVNDHCASTSRYGLWYPPDPALPLVASAATWPPTPAGVCCVKYGVTRDYVLGLQVVTGTV